MRKNRANGAIMISTTIAPLLWKKAQDAGISWAEAIRIGITQLLNKAGDQTYLNTTQQDRKIQSLATLLDQYARDLDAIRAENEKLKQEMRKNG